MEQFQYTYLTFNEVMSNIIYIYKFTPMDYIILFVLLYITYIIFYYYFPYLQINEEKILEKINQDKKRNFIKKIWLQTEMEEEIETEIEKESLLKYVKK